MISVPNNGTEKELNKATYISTQIHLISTSDCDYPHSRHLGRRGPTCTRRTNCAKRQCGWIGVLGVLLCLGESDLVQSISKTTESAAL